jgi:hypothetical protein
MAELLLRQCNVAVPEIDVGTDMFAFLDEEEVVARVQVKTARAERYKKEAGCSALFDIPLRQLDQPDQPALYYVFAVRLGEQWVDFLVIGRTQLNDYWNSDRRFGTANPASGSLVLTIRFRPESVLCGEVDLTGHRNAWDLLPPLAAPGSSTIGQALGGLAEPAPPTDDGGLASAPPEAPSAETPPPA